LDSILGGAGSIGSLLGALGKNGSGGSMDLTKLASQIKNLIKRKPGQTPDDYGFDPNTHGEPDPIPSDDGYGFDPNTHGEPDPQVSTDTTFNGIPGGYGGAPEDPLSADPEWWKQFVVDDNTALGAGGDDPNQRTGTDWWDE
jgi:hypothetical protein